MEPADAAAVPAAPARREPADHRLFSYPGFYDIALRDFGLLLAAVILARLASVYDPPWRRRRAGTAG